MTAFGQSGPLRFDQATELPLAKLRDARKTLNKFLDAWKNYCGRLETGFELIMTETGVLTYIARIRPSVSDEDLERRLRSVVSDVRSALDNLVHGIGTHVGADDSALKNNAFPVVADAKSWKQKGKSRLRQLPEAVVDRIHDVQPFARPRQVPYPEHPLVLLSDLDNGNKHRDSFQVGLVPNPGVSVHELSSMSFEVSAEVAAQLSQEQPSAEDVDAMLKFPAWGRPVHDGDPVLEVRLPVGVEPSAVTETSLDLPLSLAAVYDRGENGCFPIRPAILDAWTYVRDTIRYVGGLDTTRPEPAELAQEAIDWPQPP